MRDAIGILKTCTCGASYTPIEWMHLEYVGLQKFDGEDPDLELRNCSECGSTLGIEIPPTDLRRGMLFACMPRVGVFQI
jgi:hypothetical protein